MFIDMYNFKLSSYNSIYFQSLVGTYFIQLQKPRIQA